MMAAKTSSTTSTKAAASKAAANDATATKPTWDPDKTYAVTMARTVPDHDGFAFKPGPNPIEMSGALVTALAERFGDDVVAEAKELPSADPHPEAPQPVHEVADQ